MIKTRSFLFVLFLAYALLMLTFLHDKNQSNIYFVNVYRNSANALLRIFSLEVHFIYRSYLILLVHLGEHLRDPHALTLFIRFTTYLMTVNLVQWRAVIGILIAEAQRYRTIYTI